MKSRLSVKEYHNHLMDSGERVLIQFYNLSFLLNKSTGMKFLLQYVFSPSTKSYSPKVTFAFYNNLASSSHECIEPFIYSGNNKIKNIILLWWLFI